MQQLFIYGTLQNPEIQLTIIGRLIEGIPDKLTGFKISTLTTEDGTYPVIVPENDSIVNGQVIIVTDAELTNIDIYETVAYQRVKVTLQSGKQAWVYTGH